MKKIIILDAGGKRGLANQLWNAVTLYAYSKETNLLFENWAIFKHAKFFNFRSSSLIIQAVFFNDLLLLGDRRVKLYRFLLRIWRIIYASRIVDSGEKKCNPQVISNILKKHNSVYTFGWLFRDANLIERQREKIINFFKPSSAIKEKIDQRFNLLRQQYQYIVGVHMRRSDYRRYNNGEYFLSDSEVVAVLKDYLRWSKIKAEDVLFYLVSDEKINSEVFSEFNVFISDNSDVDDMFSLSKTDLIIGSNSTFSAFSSFVGQVQLVIFKKDKINWTNENKINRRLSYKKCTLIHL